MMTMKSALITGAASGIGKACAERMAQEGYGVVVADVNLPLRRNWLPNWQQRASPPSPSTWMWPMSRRWRLVLTR